MDLESSRSKQRAAQQQAQTQPEGVARIGDRDPLTGRYTVQFPDGGIGANGIKTYTAMSKPGDVVVLFPRADGSVAIDSEKGSPTIVPDVFNKPVEEKKKAKVWILYFFGGKLWVGGHQSEPEEVGSVYLGGPIALSEENGGPGLILAGIGLAISSNLHVWGDDSGWVATYQTFPPDFDFTNATTFHAVTSTTRKKNSTSFAFGEDGGIRGSNRDSIESNTRSFPLGAGFVSYRSIRGISSINPPLIYDSTVSQTASAVHQASIGYMENAVPTVNQFSISASRASIVFSYINTNEIISYSGTIPVPNQNRQTILPYSGSFSCPEQSTSDLGPYLKNSVVVYPELSAQIIHNYPILCDRFSTYYIQESIIINGTSSIQKVYELRSTISQELIARNYAEPRFFGIRWDTRESAYITGLWPDTGTARYKQVTYSDPAYYYPNYYLNATSSGNSVLPIGHFTRLVDNVRPFDEYYAYPYFVTFSGGQVVTIEASEINKAKIGSAYLQRRSVAVDGTFSDLGTVFCHPIPSTAIVYHWSTTA